MNRPVLFALLVAASLAPLSAQTKPKKTKPKVQPAAVAAPQPAPAPEPTPAPKPKPRVRLDTSYGPVVVELEPDLAPVTVENFLGYVKSGHYVGTIFHRVMDGFMVQGGGFTEDLVEKPTRAPIRNEAPATFRGGLKNTRGTIAMARTGDPHSATSQFYINLVDNQALDFKADNAQGIGYCAFGRVVEGMEAVDKIARVRVGIRRGMEAVPEYAVRIKGATVVER